MSIIETLNNDPEVHGILVQLPLPDHLESKDVIEAIDPAKDVDGFHTSNVGELWTSGEAFCSLYATRLSEASEIC